MNLKLLLAAEAISHGVHSADVVLNILARQRDPDPPITILTPAALTLRRRLCPLRQPQENRLMERTHVRPYGRAQEQAQSPGTLSENFEPEIVHITTSPRRVGTNDRTQQRSA